jgi:hypothetical protein
MRYERMFVALVAAAFFAFLGLWFFSAALQAAQFATWPELLSLRNSSLRAVNLGLFSVGLLTLALSFICSAAIKIQVPRMAERLHIFIAIQRFALLLLWVAAFIAVLGTLLQAIAFAVNGA